LAHDTSLYLPLHPLLAARPNQAPRRAAIWLAVAAIHVLFLSIFMISEALPTLFRHSGAETLILLPQLPGNANAPPVPELARPLPDRGIPEVMPQPITIPPPVITPEQPPAGATQGDVLNAIGQELGCGANSFEYLTPAEQQRCRRIPWHGVKLPNGVIVLEPPSASPFRLPEPERMTGAEARRQEMNRAPDCPLVLNLPCMNNFLHDRN
jgi:hypothetical protein